MFLRVLLSLALVALLARGASAGGGPENVLLIVNGRSVFSLSVANQYARLRQIPPGNIVVLDYDGNTDTVTGDEFLTKIFQPALTQMAARSIGGQIDYVVYSADLPSAVDLKDWGKPDGIPAGSSLAFTPTASINGLTFLWQFALTKTPKIVAPRLNNYFRHPQGRPSLPTQAFSAWRGWDVSGAVKNDGGVHYYLSTMLAVTGKRGLTLPETVSYLKRAAAVDGRKPTGTIYYCQSTDKARSSPRHGKFADAVQALNRIGVKGVVLQAAAPQGKNDVLGCMMGVDKFVWRDTGSVILPGAICDHLTSFGGVIRKGSQTSLCEYLRNGAAGASGTVVEPLAIPEKFPHPEIHVHYARGCSLAEAFYQSIGWPLQDLIVGDPLCRPWANIPRVTVEGVAANQHLKGTIAVKPRATVAGSRGVDRFELFVDGVRREKCRPAGELPLDTTQLTDGAHELRIVAIEAGAIESQGRLVLAVTVENHGKSLKFAAASAKRLAWGKPIEVTVNAAGADSIVVTHHGREVGRVDKAFGKISIPAKQVGQGPVTLQAVAFAGKDDAKVPLAIAAPVDIDILDEAGK
jgi:hypothetical protein